MKKLLKSLIVGTVLVSSLVATETMAATVNFIPLMQGRQYFECTSSDPGASITLDTHNVDAQGFCPGKGHLTTDGKTVNTNYFTVAKAGGRPSMTISGPVTCKLMSGPDPDRTEYGAGQPFCSMVSGKK